MSHILDSTFGITLHVLRGLAFSSGCFFSVVSVLFFLGFAVSLCSGRSRQVVMNLFFTSCFFAIFGAALVFAVGVPR